nr:hypothetical protein DGKKSRWO_DGKKSRWO_CDS_0100 [uncultured phage]CAI9752277.1 hypothetical protein CVNMHQAP_CVNMHQAP_CDS_0100 [uncultured phage]
MISVSEKEQARGVFWVIDDELFAFPYYSGNEIGVAKSGITFNHKRLWNDMNLGYNVPYNYYPRGRVDFTNKGKPIVYMNPNIDSSFISKIKTEFGLREEPRVQYDNSNHYKCYLDDDWKPDNSK